MPNRRLFGTDIQPVNLAVDLGGTHLRWALADARGRVVQTHRGPSVPPPRLADRLRRSIPARFRRSIRHLVIGSKGVWTRSERNNLRRQCRGLAERVTIFSDGELGFWTSVGRVSASGLYLAVGTGSLVLGRTATGRWVRAGGEGPRRGDEGSGFWMGREYLRRLKGKRESVLGRLSATPAAVRRTAALARRVATRAETDPRCRSILQEAEQHLVRLVGEASRFFRAPGRIFLGGGGALYESAPFRAGLWRRLRRSWPGRFVPVRPARDVARRAAREAERLAQREPRSVPPRRLAKK